MKRLLFILLTFSLVSCSSVKNNMTLENYYKHNKISYVVGIDAFLNRNCYWIDRDGALVNGNIKKSEEGKYVVIGNVKSGVLGGAINKKYIFSSEINNYLKREKVNYTLDKNAFYRNGKIFDKNGKVINGIVYMNTKEKESNFTLVASVFGGKYNGVLMEFINETPRKKEIYSNGKLNGKSEYYLENGYFKMTAEYKDGVYNGKVIKYYDGKDLYGRILSEAEFRNGYLNGKEIEYYPNGVKKYEANYVKDVLNGKYMVYNENGNLDRVFTFFSGKAQGESLVFYPDSKEILMRTNYSRGKVEGKEIYYYPNGNLAVETTYKNGKVSAPVIAYWPNGTRKLIIDNIGTKVGYCYDDAGKKYRNFTNVERSNYILESDLFKLSTSQICADKK